VRYLALLVINCSLSWLILLLFTSFPPSVIIFTHHISWFDVLCRQLLDTDDIHGFVFWCQGSVLFSYIATVLKKMYASRMKHIGGPRVDNPCFTLRRVAAAFGCSIGDTSAVGRKALVQRIGITPCYLILKCCINRCNFPLGSVSASVSAWCVKREDVELWNRASSLESPSLQHFTLVHTMEQDTVRSCENCPFRNSRI
jgi:hypothetical protein